MPRRNRFRHQAYQSAPPTSPYRLLTSGPPTEPSSAEFDQRLAAAGARFSQAGVAAIYCVHGTFCGDDVLGLFTELEGWAPSVARPLRRWSKRAIDAVIGETGNYTPAFAERMEMALSAGASRRVPVRLFNWSSLNHHIGRADGAVRLIDELAERSEQLTSSQSDARIILWAHSHGGNVFALLTNLLGADETARQEFFHA